MLILYKEYKYKLKRAREREVTRNMYCLKETVQYTSKPKPHLGAINKRPLHWI